MQFSDFFEPGNQIARSLFMFMYFICVFDWVFVHVILNSDLIFTLYFRFRSNSSEPIWTPIPNQAPQLKTPKIKKTHPILNSHLRKRLRSHQRLRGHARVPRGRRHSRWRPGGGCCTGRGTGTCRASSRPRSCTGRCGHSCWRPCWCGACGPWRTPRTTRFHLDTG